MIRVAEEITYPYLIQCWPPLKLSKRINMIAWLDNHVKWNGKLENAVGGPPCGSTVECHQNLHYTFRVHSLEDVGILKMSL